MSTTTLRRGIGVVAASAALAGTVFTAAPAHASSSTTRRIPVVAAPRHAVCSTTTTVNFLAFNDFHGRLATSGPDTAVFAATLEDLRKQAGEASTVVMSSGDNVGATLFTSQVQNDVPTINMMNALQLDSSTVGNHELDKLWPDFADRIVPMSNFPYIASNLVIKGTTTPAVNPYVVVNRNGVRVAIVGAITGDLKSLVSPDVFKYVDLLDPVDSVNATTQKILTQGLADVVVASYHEGSPISAPNTLADSEAQSPAFKDIVENTDPRVAAIFTAHTHQTYAWQAPVPGSTATRPVIQSGSYGSAIGDVTIKVDTSKFKKFRGTVCGTTAKNVVPATLTGTARSAYINQFPRAVAVESIVNGAIAQATILGSQALATATAPITRGTSASGVAGDRNVESTMGALVAKMYYDVLNPSNDPNFIAIQNPGGTRADFDAGTITYAEAAAVLPFANSLMTTKLTGAQVKTLLEQQWQTNADGSIPARPFLMLSTSPNLTYTYDESLPAGSRITSVSINGKPIDPAATYTIGSNSFLISGGDNFRVLAQGTGTQDAGKADLDSWVTWLKAQGTVSPSFARHGVSVSPTPTTLTAGTPVTVKVGVPVAGGVAPDTLDMRSTGATANTTLVATLNGTEVGRATVTAGQATLTITVPAGTAAGSATLVLTAPDTQTVIYLPVTIA